MPVINFIKISDLKTLLKTIYEICKKNYSKGLKVVIISDSQGEAKEIDDFLWEHEAEVFLPHEQGYDSESIDKVIRILIDRNELKDGCDILIELKRSEETTWPENITEVYEFIRAWDPDNVLFYRNKYKKYKESGMHLNFNEIK